MEFLWFLTQFRTPFTEKAAQFITYFGQDVFIIAFICVCFWSIDKKTAYRAGFSFCLAGCMVQGLKIVFRIPRPWILDKNFSPVESAVPAATGYSFPSGHTQSATSVYGSFAKTSKKLSLKIIFIVMFCLVGLSRMLLGVHTPKDVLTAMGIAIVCLFVSEWFFVRKNQTKVFILPIILIVFALGIYIYSNISYRLGIIEYRYAVDCAKCAGAALGFTLGYYLDEHVIDCPIIKGRTINIIKCISGIVLVILLKVGLKAILPRTLVCSSIRNMILILFIIVIYPMLFQFIYSKVRKVH